MARTTLRLPIAGYAKRVGDSVARGMAYLRARDELAARTSASSADAGTTSAGDLAGPSL